LPSITLIYADILPHMSKGLISAMMRAFHSNPLYLRVNIFPFLKYPGRWRNNMCAGIAYASERLTRSLPWAYGEFTMRRARRRFPVGAKPTRRRVAPAGSNRSSPARVHSRVTAPNEKPAKAPPGIAMPKRIPTAAMAGFAGVLVARKGSCQPWRLTYQGFLEEEFAAGLSIASGLSVWVHLVPNPRKPLWRHTVLRRSLFHSLPHDTQPSSSMALMIQPKTQRNRVSPPVPESGASTKPHFTLIK
jgi:hypothetical protein